MDALNVEHVQSCSEVVVVDNGQKACIVEKYRKKTLNLGEIPEILVTCAIDTADSYPV